MPCEKCEEYRAALEKIATPVGFSNPLDPQTDTIIAYISMKVAIAVEALLNGNPEATPRQIRHPAIQDR